MGNSSSKDERRQAQASSGRHASGSHAARTQSPPTQQQQQSPADRLASHIYNSRNVGGRGSRHDLSFLSMGRDRGGDDAAPDRPRETKQEREARRAERERQARVKERERSIREEGVDGGFLVTLGTYTGPEDFSKSIVRQLQIERRLAPFWKGLNDHSDSWTEAQLVAAVRGLDIPAADEVPADMARTAFQASNDPIGPDANLNSLTVPINARSQSYQSDTSTTLSTSHPAFSSSGPTSSTTASSAALLRGRAKTLASLATGSKGAATDLTPREIQLQKDPNVNGVPIEAYLYKEASECPICFLYYPPYLNKTRCCDQPICSECFVQIKRPDPHPPEHEQPGQERPPEDEAEMLVSEVAACPFCVTPEFGVTYEPPPFRRGLTYANTNPLKNLNSATSSSSSLANGGPRRRAASLSANAPNVITTDKVRPDWAKKLSDARANALRRSAAATALHNAAYVLGNPGDAQLRGGLLGRRRRTLFADSPGPSGSGTPHQPEDGSGDLFPGRTSSRRNRVDDLEDLMMMEAIRLSLAAEEDRKRKEDKEAKKDEKKKAKEDKKQAKQAEKAARKRNGSGASLYPVGTNDSNSSWATSSMARSTSNLGTQPTIPEELIQGKGKRPAQDFAGFNPLFEPSSTLNTEMQQDSEGSGTPSPSPAAINPVEYPQRHLETSRANLQPLPIPSPQHSRHLSKDSSAASSYIDSAPGSLRADSNLPSGTGSNVDLPGGTTPDQHSSIEPMFNFRSLAAMIGQEDKAGSEHVEQKVPGHTVENRSRGNSGESSGSSALPAPAPDLQITPASPLPQGDEKKDLGVDVEVWERGREAH